MNEKDRQFLEDTVDILADYDGCRTENQLKGLIDEARARIIAVLDGEIEAYEDSIS